MQVYGDEPPGCGLAVFVLLGLLLLVYGVTGYLLFRRFG